MTSAEEREKFARDGYLVIPDFINEAQSDKMREECRQLVEDMDPKEHTTVFSTTKQKFRNDYFINSADKLGYFFEDGALDENEKLIVPKHRSLNKIGHAMHVLCPSFRQFTFSDKIKSILRNFEFKDPVVTQSMYIFKQPKIGGEVVPHQDGTFLYVEPMEKLLGFWVALEDTTIENGCLWFVPGSHKGGLLGDYRMVRSQKSEGPSCVFTSEKPTYDGDYVPVPVQKGSMVLIDGLVHHKSAPNLTEKSRHIYTFHAFDQGLATWSDKNWLQPTPADTFTHVYDVHLPEN